MADRAEEIYREINDATAKKGRYRYGKSAFMEACRRIVELEAEVEDYAKQHRLRAGCLQQERDNNERLRNERAALKAEVGRLTKQNAAYLLQRDSSRELRDRAQNEVERLRALVKSAFDEGMQDGGQGEYDYSPLAVDRCWAESCAKSELEGDA